MRHRGRLRFKGYMEKRYLLEHGKRNIFYWRMAMLVFLLLYAAFAVLDYVLVEDHYQLFWFLRFGLVIPMFLITIISTYFSLFEKRYESILSINYLIGGLVIATMLIMVPDNFSYYGGLFLVMFSGTLLLRIRYEITAIATFIIVLYLLIGQVLFVGDNINFLSAILFYVAASIIGLFGAYNLEIFMRNRYIAEKNITEDRDTLSVKVKQQLKDIHQAQAATIIALSKMVESKDVVTGVHIENVSMLVRKIAQALPKASFENETLPKDTYIDILTNASALHDIGKVGISDQILNKPGKLTIKERKVMEKHVVIGYETLETIKRKYPNNAFINMGSNITLYHHERFDGAGYPHGLKGYDIPLSARIMALVDVYDALISKRPYKEPWPREKAIETIKNEKGKHFDPLVVEAFLKVEREGKR